jgi:hypothetical protein
VKLFKRIPRSQSAASSPLTRKTMRSTFNNYVDRFKIIPASPTSSRYLFATFEGVSASWNGYKTLQLPFKHYNVFFMIQYICYEVFVPDSRVGTELVESKVSHGM